MFNCSLNKKKKKKKKKQHLRQKEQFFSLNFKYFEYVREVKKKRCREALTAMTINLGWAIIDQLNL